MAIDESPLERFLADPSPALAAFADALSSASTPRDVCWQLAETAGDLLGLQDCVVYQLDAAGNELVQTAAWGLKRVSRRIIENPIRLAIGQGIVGTAAGAAMPIVVCDSRLYPHYIVDDAPRLSEMALPMLSHGQLLGVFDSEHPDADFYRSAHLRAACMLVAPAAARLAALQAEPQH